MSLGLISWDATDKIASGQLTFDVVISEAPIFSADVTKRPVESGSDLTDHIRRQLVSLTVSGFISNTPVEPESNIVTFLPVTRGAMAPLDLSGQGPDAPVPMKATTPVKFDPPIVLPGTQMTATRTNVANQVPAAAGFAQTLQFPTAFNAVEETLALLNRLLGSGILVTYTSRDYALDNMAITRISPSRNAESGSGSEISVEFSEIAMVSTKQTTRPLILRAARPAAAGPKAGEDAAGKKKSLLLTGGEKAAAWWASVTQ